MKWQFTLIKIFNLHGWLLDFQPIMIISFQLEGLRQAVLAGYKALTGLDGTPTSLHAAAATVAVMEDHWAFNAGYGSVLNEVWKLSERSLKWKVRERSDVWKTADASKTKKEVFFFFIFQIGKVQMDAAVMNGQDLNYGGVMCIGRLLNKQI